MIGVFNASEIAIDREEKNGVAPMIMQIEIVLAANAVGETRIALLAEADAFQPDATTAGWHARELKRNEQSAGPAAAKTSASHL